MAKFAVDEPVAELHRGHEASPDAGRPEADDGCVSRPFARAARHTVFATACVALLSASSCIFPISPNTPQLVHADYDTYAPGWPEGDYAPKVTGDGAGRWLVAWYGNSRVYGPNYLSCSPLAGKTPMVYSSLSVDQGNSWPAPSCENTAPISAVGADVSPSIATDRKGNWVLAWESDGSVMGQALGSDTDILVALSTTAKWAAPAHPYQPPFALNTNAASDTGDDRSPQLATDGKGTWAAVWHSFDTLGATIGSDADILIAVSTNDGQTWTAPQPLNTNATTDTGPDLYPRIATDGKGVWAVVWTSDEPLGAAGLGTDNDILLARSVDPNLLVWSAPQPVNSNAAGDIGDDVQPDIATNGAGVWVVVWTSDDPLGSAALGNDLDILVTRSTDATLATNAWEAPRALTSFADTDSTPDSQPSLAYGSGGWIVVWSSSWPGTSSWTLGPDADILISISENDAQKWGFHQVHNTADSDSSDDVAPAIATDGKGNWVIVWTSDYPGGTGQSWGLDDDILAVQFRY